jgi:hypothetical protein
MHKKRRFGWLRKCKDLRSDPWSRLFRTNLEYQPPRNRPIRSIARNISRALRRAAINAFVSEPTLRVMEVKRRKRGSGWQAVFQGQKFVLLKSASEECAIDDATDFLLERGGGEVQVVDEAGEVTARAWALIPWLAAPSTTPWIDGKEWLRQQSDGWKHFTNISLPKVIADSPIATFEKRCGWELIELLQALLGRENVAVGIACGEGGPVEVSDERGIFIRCSDETLLTLGQSTSWFVLLFIPPRFSYLKVLPKQKPRTYILSMESFVEGGNVSLGDAASVGEVADRLRISNP